MNLCFRTCAPRRSLASSVAKSRRKRESDGSGSATDCQSCGCSSTSVQYLTVTIIGVKVVQTMSKRCYSILLAAGVEWEGCVSFNA